MPFFLLFEAACFKVPCLIWKYFASQSGWTNQLGLPENGNLIYLQVSSLLYLSATVSYRMTIKISRFLFLPSHNNKFSSNSGMRIGEILRLSSSDTNGVPEVKKSNVEALGVHLNGALRFHKILNHVSIFSINSLNFLSSATIDSTQNSTVSQRKILDVLRDSHLFHRQDSLLA